MCHIPRDRSSLPPCQQPARVPWAVIRSAGQVLLGRDVKLPQLGCAPSTSSSKPHPAQSSNPKQFPSQGELNPGAAWLW